MPGTVFAREWSAVSPPVRLKIRLPVATDSICGRARATRLAARPSAMPPAPAAPAAAVQCKEESAEAERTEADGDKAGEFCERDQALKQAAAQPAGEVQASGPGAPSCDAFSEEQLALFASLHDERDEEGKHAFSRSDIMARMGLRSVNYATLVDATGVKSRLQGRTRDRSVTRVCVGGIPWGITEEQLRKDFGECGQIDQVALLAKAAFITFNTPAAAQRALDFDTSSRRGAFRLGPPDEEASFTKSAVTEKDMEKDSTVTKVFIYGISWGSSEEQLRNDFGKCGQIDEVTLPDKIACITFKTSAATEKALQFNGNDYKGNTLKVKPVFDKGGDDIGTSKGGRRKTSMHDEGKAGNDKKRKRQSVEDGDIDDDDSGDE